MSRRISSKFASTALLLASIAVLLDRTQPPADCWTEFCSGKVAWQEEFWPTTAAEYLLHLLWTLSKRALWLSDPESRQSYIAAVPKVIPARQLYKPAAMGSVSPASLWRRLMTNCTRYSNVCAGVRRPAHLQVIVPASEYVCW